MGTVPVDRIQTTSRQDSTPKRKEDLMSHVLEWESLVHDGGSFQRYMTYFKSGDKILPPLVFEITHLVGYRCYAFYPLPDMKVVPARAFYVGQKKFQTARLYETYQNSRLVYYRMKKDNSDIYSYNIYQSQWYSN
jgi:hypothetical protein